MWKHHLTRRLKSKDRVNFFICHPCKFRPLPAYLRQLPSCHRHARCLFPYLWLPWAWPIERSQMVNTLASEVIILMLREPLLEKYCLSTSAAHTLSTEKFLEPEWAGSPTAAAGELRPQDVPAGSREEESVQGAGPGGRPWPGLCCSEMPSSRGNRCQQTPPYPSGTSSFCWGSHPSGAALCFRLVAPKGFLCGIWSVMLEDNSRHPLTLFKGREMGWELRVGSVIQGDVTSCPLPQPQLLHHPRAEMISRSLGSLL